MLYQNLKEVIDKIIIDHTSVDHRLTLICGVLQENIDYYDWVGFYFANHKEQTLHFIP